MSGYNFQYPFLRADSGIRIDDNYVYPLYKQILNIKYPNSMAFIGIPQAAAYNRMFDLQVIKSDLKVTALQVLNI